MSAPGPSQLLHSARRIDARGVVDDAWLLLQGTEIAAAGQGLATAPDADLRVDLAGATVTPGFIDLHVHGGGGHAFEDGPEALAAGLAAHRRHGTTRSVVSLVANPLPTLHSSLAAIAQLAEHDPLVLGAHLEGPYLDRGHRGAHNPAFLREPSSSEIDDLLDAAGGHLCQLTLAPELPGALAAVEQLVDAGVAVAVGHTDAGAATARAAFDRGATLLTHAFNAMPGIHHRAPGPVVAALADPRVVLELVLDGLHVDPDVAAMVFGAAPQRIALITDGMAAAGAADGHYRLGSLNVSVEGGRAVLSGTDTIAGSTLTQDAALRIAVERAGVDPVLAVTALTRTPARAVRRDHRLGLLDPGFAADVVVLDRTWRARRVWADGVELV